MTEYSRFSFRFFFLSYFFLFFQVERMYPNARSQRFPSLLSLRSWSFFGGGGGGGVVEKMEEELAEGAVCQ